jgi:O-Antigen ligase
MIALIIYIALAFYFGRKNPMFYLIVVFALQQGPAAFIDQSIAISGKNIFLVVDQIFTDVLFFITTLIAIGLFRAKMPVNNYQGSRLLFLYLLYIIFLFIVAFASDTDPVEVLLSGRQLLYISLSYFLWLSIFHVVTRQQYEAFLRMLFYVTPVSAVLYILNSSGRVTLFNSDLIYQEIEGTSGSFFRDFATIPIQIVPVFVISLFSLVVPTFKLPKWLILTNVCVLPIAILFTFTRSILVGISIQLLALILLYIFANKGQVFRQIVTLLVVILMFFIPTYLIAAKMYPDAVAYFTERLSDAAVEKGNDENVDIRLMYLNKTIEITQKTSEVIGAGLNRQYYPQLDAIGAWIADSTLPYLLYHTGWLGIGLLYCILLYFIIDSALYFKKSNDWLVAFICSTLITTTISSLLMGGGMFTGSVWTFMNLALYTTIRFNAWKKIRAAVDII